MRVSLGWSFLLAVLGWLAIGAAGLSLIQSAWSVLTLLLVAASLAALIRAPVEALGRRIPRLAAVLLVVLGLSAVAGGVTANETWQLGRHADAVSATISERIEALDEDSDLRRFLVEARVAERAEEVLQRIPRLVIFGTADQGESARRGLDVLLVAILTIYAALNGPQVAGNLTGAIIDPDRRRLVHESARDGLDRAAAYVRRSLAWGALSGLVAGGLAVALDLTGPTTLGVWAGVWSIVPVLGVAVGYAPIVLLAALDSAGVALVVAGVGLAWWVFSLTVVDRIVAARTVRLGPLVVTVALAFGLQFGWLVGSLVSLLLVGWGAAFLSEVARRAQPGDHPLGELTDDAGEPTGDEVPLVLAAAPADRRPTAGRRPGLVAVDGGDRTGTAAATVGPPGARGPAGTADQVRLVWNSLDARSGARATVLVVTALVALGLLRSAQPGPTWIVVGVVVGMALDPAAQWVGRRTRLPRGPAVGVVVGGAVLSMAAVVVVAVPSLIDNLSTFDQEVVQVADDLERLPVVGDELGRRGVGEQLRREISRLPDELAADPTPVTEALRTAGDVAVGTFWTLLVAVATLVDGRRIAAHARTIVPAGHRDRCDDLVALLYDTVVRYAAGSALVSGLVGLAVFLTAVALGIPLAPVLGVWALLWTFVPQIGGLLAAVPLVLLAMGEGTTDAIVALACYGVAWQVKNRILMPVVIGRAVNLSPVVAMTAVLVGGAAGGLVGAILATPLVGTVRLVHRHLRAGPASPSEVGEPGGAQPVTAPEAAASVPR